MPKRYWLLKSEPATFSIDDLMRDKTTYWSGVRNYQARNTLRDQMQVGDGALFYHSSSELIGIAGMAEVIKAGYPDVTAWDPKDDHYDPKSLPTKPIWFMVDIRFVKKTREIITLQRLKEISSLKKMVVVQRGSRLSVQPVRPEEWEIIRKLPEWKG